MDFPGYLALGGLERVAIIAGALVIGYWGYRLYAAEKPAGLAFMTIACLVLAGALITGGSHVRSVGESLQVASVPQPPAGHPGAPQAVEAAGVAAPAPAAAAPPARPAATKPPQAIPTDASLPEAVSTAAIPPEAIPPEAIPPEAIPPEAPPPVATPSRANSIDDAAIRLATGQELGGRILSVKSKNLSLEWSPVSEPESE